MSPSSTPPGAGAKTASVADGIQASAEVEVSVPAAEVFQFWRALENFPRFMEHVKEVRHERDDTYLWRVSAPAGTEVSWRAKVTGVEANRRIAWASLAGEGLENRGEVRFTPTAAGTRIHVELAYKPPAGVVGHAVATLMGLSPGQQMDSDLQRCRTLLEEGHAERDGGVVTADKVRADEPQRRSVR